MTTMNWYLLLHRSQYVNRVHQSWQTLFVRMHVREAASECVRTDLYEEQAQITSISISQAVSSSYIHVYYSRTHIILLSHNLQVPITKEIEHAELQ